MSDEARRAWNAVSEWYQRKVTISLEDVHYGPISPGERELGLLGDVSGRRVLELGCGGGQNSIVLSKWGAHVTGLDVSERQLDHARKLAEEEKVDVRFLHRSMEDLAPLARQRFDIVLSSHALQFVEDWSRVFREINTVLNPEGLFVFAMSHPVLSSGRWTIMEGRKVFVLRDYFDDAPEIETWVGEAQEKIEIPLYHHTVQDTFDLLLESGFRVERIVEPKPYPLEEMSEEERRGMPYTAEEYERLESDDLEEPGYELWKRLPYTMIFKASKTRSLGQDRG